MGGGSIGVGGLWYVDRRGRGAEATGEFGYRLDVW